MYKPLTSKVLKPLIGTEMWVIPGGNSVNHGTPLKEQIKGGILEKVGTKKVTLSNYIGSFYLDGSYDSNNYHYFLFPSKEKAIEHLGNVDFLHRLRCGEISVTQEQVTSIRKLLSNES